VKVICRNVHCEILSFMAPNTLSHGQDGAPGDGAEDCITRAHRLWQAEHADFGGLSSGDPQSSSDLTSWSPAQLFYVNSGWWSTTKPQLKAAFDSSLPFTDLDLKRLSRRRGATVRIVVLGSSVSQT